MGAVAAFFDMTAKGGRTAGLDGAHGLELFERHRVRVAIRLAVLPEDVGQLDSWPGHGGLGFPGLAARLGQGVQRRDRGPDFTRTDMRVARGGVDAGVPQ